MHAHSGHLGFKMHVLVMLIPKAFAMHAASRGPASLQALCMHVHDYLDLQQISELQVMQGLNIPSL